MRSHCCGVVLNGKFHLLGGQTKRSNDMSADVESNMHQVYVPSGKQGAWEFRQKGSESSEKVSNVRKVFKISSDKPYS